MGKLMLVDGGGTFFLKIMEGDRVLGSASMGKDELRAASKRFDQAARVLESREPRPEEYRGLGYFLPSPSSRARLR